MILPLRMSTAAILTCLSSGTVVSWRCRSCRALGLRGRRLRVFVKLSSGIRIRVRRARFRGWDSWCRLLLSSVSCCLCFLMAFDLCWRTDKLTGNADNMGWQAHLVHEDVIKQVVEQHPRLKWSGCFSKAIKAEIEVCLPRNRYGWKDFADRSTRPNLGATPLSFRAFPKRWPTTSSWNVMIRLVPLALSKYDRLARVCLLHGVLEYFSAHHLISWRRCSDARLLSQSKKSTPIDNHEGDTQPRQSHY